MNDRYLYRAKRKKWKLFPEAQQWVQGYYVHTAESDYIVRPYEHTTLLGEGEAVEIEANTLCQCTGLKDKNGKSIWENDIMVAHLDDSFPEDTTYARVVWNNNGFCTKEQGSEDISPLDKFDQEYFEVCGNRFDNQELLEVGE